MKQATGGRHGRRPTTPPRCNKVIHWWQAQPVRELMLNRLGTLVNISERTIIILDNRRGVWES